MIRKTIFYFLFIFNATITAQVTPVDVSRSIDRKVDEMTGDITLMAPLGTPTGFMKIIKNGSEAYYLALSTYGATCVVNEKGVIVLFDDNTKISWHDKDVKVDVYNGKFEYSSFIRLTDDEAKQFATKKIKKFRLYIFDESIPPEDGNLFANYVNYIYNNK